MFETASGYSLFERLQSEEIGSKLESVQSSITDLSKFSKMLKLKSFAPFKSAADALENANDVSEGKKKSFFNNEENFFCYFLACVKFLY